MGPNFHFCSNRLNLSRISTEKNTLEELEYAIVNADVQNNKKVFEDYLGMAGSDIII